MIRFYICSLNLSLYQTVTKNVQKDIISVHPYVTQCRKEAICYTHVLSTLFSSDNRSYHSEWRAGKRESIRNSGHLSPKKQMPVFSSVQFSRSVVSDSLPPHESQHTRPPCPSPTPGVHSDSSPSSQWCHPAISSSVVSFSCPQSLPASESFPMNQLFAWGCLSYTSIKM